MKYVKIYCIVDIVGNEIADMLWLPLSILDTFESKEVVVYGIYINFNICFGILTTVNVALLCIIYIMWTNKQEKTTHSALTSGNVLL